MIKAILFDFFGIFTKDRWRAFRKSLPAGPVMRRVQELWHQYNEAHISYDQFLSGVQAATGHRAEEIEQLLSRRGSKNLELLEYLRHLTPRYKIGLLSNVANNSIREKYLSEDEQAIFDVMVMSYEVGMIKPDPQIFKLACEKLGVEPEETIFIDDIDAYCAAAARLGMKTIVYKDFNQMKRELEAVLR